MGPPCKNERPWRAADLKTAGLGCSLRALLAPAQVFADVMVELAMDLVECSVYRIGDRIQSDYGPESDERSKKGILNQVLSGFLLVKLRNELSCP